MLSFEPQSHSQYQLSRSDQGERPHTHRPSISLSIFHDVSQVANSDDLTHTIDYANVAEKIKSAVTTKSFICLQDLSVHVCDAISLLPAVKTFLDSLRVYLKVKQLKAPLHSKIVAVDFTATFSADGSWRPQKVTHYVEDLSCPVIVGVGIAERLEKQEVVVNLSVDTGDKGLDRDDWIDLRALTRVLYEVYAGHLFIYARSLRSNPFFVGN